MSKIAVLMIACADVFAASGCAMDWPDRDIDQTVVPETETALVAEDVNPDAIGQFHVIRLVNTQLCIQPKGRSAGDVEVELAPCVRSAPAQNWLFSQRSNGWLIINSQSGKCLYNAQPLPVSNGGRPILHGGCNASDTGLPASNALWNPSTVTGLAYLESRIQHRNSGFCLDVPFGNAFAGATMWMWQCNRTPPQAWIVGIE